MDIAQHLPPWRSLYRDDFSSDHTSEAGSPNGFVLCDTDNEQLDITSNLIEDWYRLNRSSRPSTPNDLNVDDVLNIIMQWESATSQSQPPTPSGSSNGFKPSVTSSSILEPSPYVGTVSASKANTCFHFAPEPTKKETADAPFSELKFRSVSEP